MGKRLIRITSAPAFGALLPDSEVQVILQSGVTIPGLFVKTEAKFIFLKDKGRKIHCILTSDIREVMIDKVAPY